MHNTLFKKLSLILISLIFSLIIVELLLRILGFHPWKYVSSQNQKIFDYDQKIGWKSKQGVYDVIASDEFKIKTILTILNDKSRYTGNNLSDKKILNAYHLYVIRVNKNETSKNRQELFRFMREKNLHVNVHYIPIHHHPYYVKKGFKKSNFPVAENYFETCISITIYPGLKKEDFRKVVKTIKIFFNFDEK